MKLLVLYTKRLIGDTQGFQSIILSGGSSNKTLKEINREIPLWKAKFNRSISIVEDQVLEGFRIIALPLWEHVAGNIAIMEDKLSLESKKNITAAVEDSL